MPQLIQKLQKQWAMTTYTTTKLPNGDIVEVRTNVGATPLVFVNGILQTTDDAKKYHKYATDTRLPWMEWFAWRPVKDIHGEWHWWETVYRKIGNTYVDHDDFTWYHYGTLFDVLENE